MKMNEKLIAGLALTGLIVAVGCGHKQQAAYSPPPPIVRAPAPPVAGPTPPSAASAPPAVAEAPAESTDEAFVAAHAPIYSETGLASWYGPPYHNHRGANGQVFDQNAISAAHRTLPMGSLIRVTNLGTGQSAVMRITDRGPFVPNRGALKKLKKPFMGAKPVNTPSAPRRKPH